MCGSIATSRARHLVFVGIRDGKFVYQRECEKFNAFTFLSFMKLLRTRALKNRRRVVVVTDNARYHHATLHQEWRTMNEPGFSLDFLPPYSPDLNPIERVWKLTRRMCLHNRYFPVIEEVIDGVERCFGKWQQPNDTLRRLCAIT